MYVKMITALKKTTVLLSSLANYGLLNTRQIEARMQFVVQADRHNIL